MDEFSIILQSKLTDTDCMEITNALNEVYHRGRADAEKEHNAMCDSCIHKVSKEDIDQIRKDAIDECIKTIIDYCGGLPNGMYVNALEQLKEQKNE